MMSNGQKLAENKRIATEFHRSAVEGQPDPIFVVAEEDQVVVCAYQPQPEPADPDALFTFFRFDAYRVRDGQVVEHRSGLNQAAPYTVPPLTATTEIPPARLGPERTPEELERNKRLVLDLYRVVFDGQNVDAVKDFVQEDYIQHAAHIAPGRAGLEAFVRAAFPDGPVPVKDEVDPPAIMVAEGDLVAFAGLLPQPDPDAPGSTYDYFVFDGFRVEDGLLAEHWSGVNKTALPRH